MIKAFLFSWPAGEEAPLRTFLFTDHIRHMIVQL